MADQKEGEKRPRIDVPGKLNDISRRLRMLEEGLTSLEERTEHFKKNLFDRISEQEEKEEHTAKIASLAMQDAEKLKEEVKKIRKDMAKLAPLSRVNELSSYLNIIDPMNMMTRSEVVKLIKEEARNGNTRQPDR